MYNHTVGNIVWLDWPCMLFIIFAVLDCAGPLCFMVTVLRLGYLLRYYSSFQKLTCLVDHEHVQLVSL